VSAVLGDRLEAGPVYFAVPSLLLFAGVAAGCLAAALVRQGGSPAPLVGPPGTARGKGVVLGLLCLGLALAWMLTTWGAAWMDLWPTRRRVLLGLALLPALVPLSLALAVGFQRLTGGGTARWGRLARGLVWLALPLVLWAGHMSFAVANWPLFTVPVLLLAFSFVVPLPLWLLPNTRGMALARAVSHAGAAAWLLACHLPFVHGG
jgi:hypothetical protein